MKTPHKKRKIHPLHDATEKEDLESKGNNGLTYITRVNEVWEDGLLYENLFFSMVIFVILLRQKDSITSLRSKLEIYILGLFLLIFLMQAFQSNDGLCCFVILLSF